ncbi:endoribonuclease L-PSP, putative [Thermanaerovibrio velox DSM 12556]|uniref:Endoribonuclease L-PSP, putative n=1 Tax=Thermanaerovibrio velox DSM 12556 TaxID=926567 RepID=H0UQF0_9BACT|nr:RidA family protein [Thermanaerovibrio velox]EHM09704.1 endoribonuclease L-PSP, putative [Thermanaerovibrio velox DSM 12556]
MKKIINTDKAPGAIGPYSQGVCAGPFFFFSGQIPLDPATGQMVGSDAASQAERVLENVKALLESQGLSFKDVVKTTVFITDMANFAAVNEVYSRYFTEDYPARSCVAVAALPKGALVEIEVVAYKG